MTRRCTIEGCNSRSDKPEHRGVTFHSFPFDSKTRDIWIVNCKIPADKNITKSVAVCSRHFRRADFTAVKGGKYTLKPGSAPTIFPWGKIDHVRNDNETKGSDLKNVANTLGSSESEESKTFETKVEGVKSSKRVKSDDELFSKDNPKKIPKLEAENKSPSTNSNSKIPKKESLNFVPGVVVEAQDFDGVWHMAKVDEVDNIEREVLLKFEGKEGKGYSKRGTEEWIPMNSRRLRPYVDKSNKPEQFFIAGERIMARWSGARKFPATISKVLDNGTYDVVFDDGFVKVVKGAHISKIRQNKTAVASSALSPKTNEQQPEPKISTTPSTKSASSSLSGLGKNSKTNKKFWPLISKESLNLDELNLPHIPEDGEWCCHWVNDQPIGKEGFLMVGDHKKPTVIVDDWRLPSGWIKHMYQRSNVLGKWDVILVSPQGKRFRSKADLKQFIEEQGQIYNPDVYDFSIHRRRAKDINAYVYTKDYKPPPAIPKEAAYANVKPIEGGLPSLLPPPLNSTVLSALTSIENEIQQTGTSPAHQAKSSGTEDSNAGILKLEDGWVYVGGLKVQIIENLFRCPEQNCNKNFRKENHLQIHVKHYHHELAKLLGVCPNMQELALKRTLGEPTEDHLPKNHLPNAQFFAKVHQQEIQAKNQRIQKTSFASNSFTTSQRLNSPTSMTSYQQNINVPILPPEKLTSDPPSTSVLDCASLSPVQISSMTDQNLLHPTGDDLKDIENKISLELSTTASAETSIKSSTVLHTPKTLSLSKNKKNIARKSNRQRTAKKFLNTSLKATVCPLLDSTINQTTTNLSPRFNDFEETRHSFNATPEISKVPSTTLKKTKNLQNLSVNESIDGNSHTTGDFPDQSQSPQYVRENGELIKIVKMRQEEIINCLCSYTEEDGLMIQCELCLCWQHGICNGIEKEKQVPEKYICYICKNPQRGRESMKYIHDQDWLYEGKLPVANYHANSPSEKETFELLKKSHTLTGNLLETKKFLHSLKVKMNVAANKDHPKMYLWAKKWEEDNIAKDKIVNKDSDTKVLDEKNKDKKEDIKLIEKVQPTIPQPEAPIEPVECQYRLLEHIKMQQQKVKERLDSIEQQVSEIEMFDGDQEMDDSKIREMLSLMIKDLTVMNKISKINTVPKTYAY
ncbi:uncharacterized protein LOC129607060 [Condylostylus longicornis]|uniref:uncharacterized protein LOC129607060 n=1 Tax=Condylostylus longicornis TaxID=2530218 RepID=UPI00244DF50F|nr:uncharacterized protein LOC129607060 [Condylostylus longicornis]